MIVTIIVLLLILLRQRNRFAEEDAKAQQNGYYGGGDFEKGQRMEEKAPYDEEDVRYGGRTARTDRPSQDASQPRYMMQHHSPSPTPSHDTSSNDGGYGGRAHPGLAQSPTRHAAGPSRSVPLTIDTERARGMERMERRSPMSSSSNSAPIGPAMYQLHQQQLKREQQQRELEDHYRKQRQIQQARPIGGSPSTTSVPSLESETGGMHSSSPSSSSSNLSNQQLLHPAVAAAAVSASSFPAPPSGPRQKTLQPYLPQHPYHPIPIPPIPVHGPIFSPALSSSTRTSDSSRRFYGTSAAFIDLIPVNRDSSATSSTWFSHMPTPSLKSSGSNVSRGRWRTKDKGKQRKVEEYARSVGMNHDDDVEVNEADIRYLDVGAPRR